MKASLVALILAASSAAADPDLADIARRLDDDDPGVRAAARKEALALPESCSADLERRSGQAKSPEGKAALHEIAITIAERRFRAGAETLAGSSWWQDRAAVLDGLGGDSVGACVYWRRHAAELAGQPDDLDLAPEEVFRDQADQVLAAWTLTNPQLLTEAAWDEVAARVQKGELEKVRLEGLELAGYHVTAPDPNAAARGWADAAMGYGPGISAVAASVLHALLRRHFIPELFRGSTTASVPVRLRIWVAVSFDSITVENGRFHADLTDAQLAERAAEMKNDDRRRGALREIARRGLPMPDGGWKRLIKDEEPAIRCMARWEGRLADADLDVAAVLAEIGSDWDNPWLAAFWDPGALSTYVKKAGDGDLKLRALRILGAYGDAASAASVLPLLDPATPGNIRGAAAGVVAHFGGDADLPRAIATLDPSSGSCDRQATSAALARRGVREGLLAVLSRMGGESPDWVEWNTYLEFIGSAPNDGELRADWANRVGPLLQWDAAAGKWRMP